MENASKALIIAGAILLAILLISLGIMVYNQAKDTVDDADLGTQEAQTFNAQFTPYLGTVSGSKANALIDAVIASNATSGKTILFDKNGTETDAKDMTRYPNNDTVTITVASYDSNGYIEKINTDK